MVMTVSKEAGESGDVLTGWRSSQRVGTGTSSTTSYPYWDTDCSDDDDDDGGSKPSELYGRCTWRIEKFSRINRRELRSNAFEVGGHKWYILLYPFGCDVSGYLSLFLCVSNHDELLPGWNHCALFTISVANKDPTKSKYSDTVHCFWKKEHDWGWKKFMELPKLSDGFMVDDTLTLMVRLQVIRETTDRLFHFVDGQYRRELFHVYHNEIEDIFWRSIEKIKGKLNKLIEDKTRWSSFGSFWLGLDQNTRHGMSKARKDTILKEVVKQFFHMREVTSPLVIGSLYSGLKFLEAQSKSDNLNATASPIIHSAQDMFVVVDDALILFEKVAIEPLPPKNDKGSFISAEDIERRKEWTADIIEGVKRRVTELGRTTLEHFVLDHIFSNIEAAYEDDVALRRQEELIREDEAARLAESELKAKRGVGKKDKKSKKKQVARL